MFEFCKKTFTQASLQILELKTKSWWKIKSVKCEYKFIARIYRLNFYKVYKVLSENILSRLRFIGYKYNLSKIT